MKLNDSSLFVLLAISLWSPASFAGDQWEAHVAQGKVARDDARCADAEACFKKALEVARANIEDESHFMETLNMLASLHHDLARYADAETEYKLALKVHSAGKSKNELKQAVYLSNLAQVYVDEARFD